MTKQLNEDDLLFEEYINQPTGWDASRIGPIAAMIWPHIRDVSYLIPVIAGLGLLASLAEGLSVAILVILLTLILGGGSEQILGEDGGTPARIAHELAQWLGGSIGTVIVCLVVVIAIRILSMAMGGLLAVRVEARVSDRVRRRLFDSMARMPLVELEKLPYGQLLNTMNRHSWSIAEAVDTFANMLLNGVSGGSILVLLLLLSPGNTIAIVVAMLATSMLLQFIRRPLQGSSEASADAARDVSSRVVQILQAARTIRAFGGVRALQRGFDAKSHDLAVTTMRTDMLSSVVEPVSHLSFVAVIITIAAISVSAGTSTTDVFVIFALLYRLQPYATAFESERVQLSTLFGPIRAIDEILALAPKPSSIEFENITLRESITFESVTFGYPAQSTPCLNQVSFTIPARRWTMLSGQSGSGKSTVIGLILGLHSPQSGRIAVDGVPLEAVDPERWSSMVAVAGQDIELINGSLEANLRLSAPNATDATIAKVVAITGLDEIIAALPDGLGSTIGERGMHFSGGERQRIGIARALLADRPILVLDEATSALDKASEEAIFMRISETYCDRTVIVAGHHIEGLLELPIAQHLVIGTH